MYLRLCVVWPCWIFCRKAGGIFYCLLKVEKPLYGNPYMTYVHIEEVAMVRFGTVSPWNASLCGQRRMRITLLSIDPFFVPTKNAFSWIKLSWVNNAGNFWYYLKTDRLGCSSQESIISFPQEKKCGSRWHAAETMTSILKRFAFLIPMLVLAPPLSNQYQKKPCSLTQTLPKCQTHLDSRFVADL